MPKQYKFECRFCGLGFDSDVIRLALHIKASHDKPRARQAA